MTANRSAPSANVHPLRRRPYIMKIYRSRNEQIRHCVTNAILFLTLLAAVDSILYGHPGTAILIASVGLLLSWLIFAFMLKKDVENGRASYLDETERACRRIPGIVQCYRQYLREKRWKR